MSIRIQMVRLIQAAMIALAIALALSGGQARAQFGEAAGIAEAMTADYLRRDIVFFQQGLNLDDAQRAIIDALYSDYEQAFEDGLAGMRKRIEDMKDELQSQDVDRVLRIVFKPIEEWSVEKRGLGEQFLENVKVVLTPEQMEQWPKFERYLFREKNLSKGTLSGETLNLFYIVRDMELTEPQNLALQPVLDEYDVELDKALRRRQQELTANQSDMLQSFAEQNSPVSLAILQRQIGMKIAVRDTNDRFIARLAEVMPDDRREEFRTKALERAYPRVYRTTPVQNIFRAAKELEGLETPVLESVMQLESDYVARLTAMNGELARTLREWEPMEERLRAEAFAQRMAGQPPTAIDDKTRDPFLRRDDVSRDATRQLKAVLTDAQFAQLPGGYRWADAPGDGPSGGQSMPTGQGDAAGAKSRRTPTKPDGDIQGDDPQPDDEPADGDDPQ